jgi:hypothetical protein
MLIRHGRTCMADFFGHVKRDVTPLFMDKFYRVTPGRNCSPVAGKLFLNIPRQLREKRPIPCPGNVLRRLQTLRASLVLLEDDQQHLEAFVGLQRVGHIRRHRHHLAGLNNHFRAADVNRCLSVQHLNECIPRGRVSAETFSLIECEEGKAVSFALSKCSADDASFLIVNQFCERMWLRKFNVLYEMCLIHIMVLSSIRISWNCPRLIILYVMVPIIIPRTERNGMRYAIIKYWSTALPRRGVVGPMRLEIR